MKDCVVIVCLEGAACRTFEEPIFSAPSLAQGGVHGLIPLDVLNPVFKFHCHVCDMVMLASHHHIAWP